MRFFWHPGTVARLESFFIYLFTHYFYHTTSVWVRAAQSHLNWPKIFVQASGYYRSIVAKSFRIGQGRADVFEKLEIWSPPFGAQRMGRLIEPGRFLPSYWTFQCHLSFVPFCRNRPPVHCLLGREYTPMRAHKILRRWQNNDPWLVKHQLFMSKLNHFFGAQGSIFPA